MSRRKKPENETLEQTIERSLFETIANHANRSEKDIWKRKLINMEKIIEKIRPIEQKILDIIENEKQPLLDEIYVLRQEMVKECIHPFDHLIQKNEYIECKFCNKKISVANG